MKKFIIIFAMLSLVACNNHPREVVYVQQPAQQIYQQPVPDAGVVAASVAAGMLIGGIAYRPGYWNAPPPAGYIVVGGNLYRDTPAVRSYNQRVTVYKTTVVNNNAANSNPVHAAPAPSNVAPAAKMTYPAPKVKNPGDAAAEIERAKMAQEAQAKAKRDADITARKESLRAASAARQQSNQSGFNKMSQSASRSGKK
jgi:hypothetical protein